MSKVRVEVVAEQFTHSYKNEDGTHTREDYVRGDIIEIDELDALAAAEGEIAKAPYVGKNSSGTDVFIYPPKTPGAKRASVRILSDGETLSSSVSSPEDTLLITPAPEPKEKPEEAFA